MNPALSVPWGAPSALAFDSRRTAATATTVNVTNSWGQLGRRCRQRRAGSVRSNEDAALSSRAVGGESGW